MRYWTKDIVLDPGDPAQNTWYVGVFSGWGGPPNGLGGLYRTTNRGVSWTRVNSLDRVTSCAFNPQNSDELYLTTETDGLWRCAHVSAANPTFTLVASYPFRQPERVFFNPYDPTRIWISSFGSGMRMGINTSTHVQSTAHGIGQLELAQNYPNPFNPSTRIEFAIPGAAFTSLKVYDLLGREVATLVNEPMTPGRHSVMFDGTHLPSSVYFCRLVSGGYTAVRKMIMAK